MESIVIKSGRGDYSVAIGSGLLGNIGETASRSWSGRRAVIVTDSNVAPLYLPFALRSLEKEGIEGYSIVVPAGEQSKNFRVLQELYKTFLQAGLSRIDGIIALGGGVVGDLAGFAAATYLRGIPFMQVPTTLLAQVDAAIGGKTGIDLPFGKNLVGAFYPPRAVLTDLATLDTLAPRHFAEGVAEIIKYGCIADSRLFAQVERGVLNRKDVVPRCVRIKGKIVEEDEHDQKQRVILNFGHTLGHAVEKVTGFRPFTHGEAVAIGMVAALRIGEALGITAPGIQDRVVRALKAWNLPTELPVAPGRLVSVLGVDKKKEGSRINFVLIKSIGEPLIHPLPLEDLEKLVLEVSHHA